MQIDIEQDDGRLKIGSEGQDHTLMTLLKQAAWEEGGQAGYDKGHPYTGGSKLVITADSPEQVLDDAVDRVRDQLDEFRDAFNNA